MTAVPTSKRPNVIVHCSVPMRDWHFRMPSSLETPLILIGPGTGIAPFMGFLSHRKALLAQSGATKPGSVDLYFGCRHQDHDWLYREEMQSLLQDGVLTKLYTAFSRDGEKQYVQDIMKSPEASERFAKLLLEDKAAIYVCGDGNAMAKDVKQAVLEVLSSKLEGGLDEASAYVETMKQEHRFLLDIWS